MPPKTKVTRDMIVDAAVEVVRQGGVGRVSARTVAERLRCSTQPVMSHFATIDSLKRAAYAQADRLHTDFLMRVPPGRDPLLGIGLNYIRFAVEEPQLFRFLFQSGYAPERSLSALMASGEQTPILSAVREALGTDEEQARDVFWTVALFTHGYASLLADNGMEFDEKQAAVRLERAFSGAVYAVLHKEAP